MNHLCGSCWALASMTVSLLYWEVQACRQHCGWDLSNAEQRRRMTSLGLLAMHCLSWVQLLALQDTQVLVSAAVFQPVGLQPALLSVWGHCSARVGLGTSLGWTLFMDLPAAPFSSLSKSLWGAAQPSALSTLLPGLSLLSACWGCTLSHHPGDKWRCLNSRSSRISPWGPPVVTVLWVDLVLLIPMHWAWLASWFSVHLSAHLPDLYLLPEFVCEDVTRDSVEILSKVKIETIHCSSFLLHCRSLSCWLGLMSPL